MKISEAIKKLQELYDEHGDLPVVRYVDVSDEDCMGYDEEINWISLNAEENGVSLD